MFGLLLSLVGMACLSVAAVTSILLFGLMPIVSLIDCARSDHLQGSAKGLWIAALVVVWGLGALAYNVFATQSTVLRRVTLGTLGLFAVSTLFGVSSMGIATTLFSASYDDSSSVDPQPTARAPDPRRGIPEVELPATSVRPEEVASFKALILLPMSQLKWQVSVADFGLDGPDPQSALPVQSGLVQTVRLVGVDTSTTPPGVSAITKTQVGVIDAAGAFTKMPSDPTLNRLIRPTGVAFVASRQALVVAGWNRGVSLDVASGTWSELPSFRGQEVAALAYDPVKDTLWALLSDARRQHLDRLARYNAQGALIEEIALSQSLPTSLSDPRAHQLVMSSGHLLVLESPFPPMGTNAPPSRRTMTIYVITPETGAIGVVEDSEATRPGSVSP